MQREKTGIKGIDEMLGGGFPAHSIIGVSGPPGVGKSIFALHFLLEGARRGQKSVYINLEEPQSNVQRMIDEFSFSKEFNGYVTENQIIIKCFTYAEYEKVQKDLLQKIHDDPEVKRLVIDTFNCFFTSLSEIDTASFQSQIASRRMITATLSRLRTQNMTALLILENGKDAPLGVYFNIPHLVDGMIALDFLELGTIERRVFIPKMRWTNQYKESKLFEIGRKGIATLDGDV